MSYLYRKYPSISFLQYPYIIYLYLIDTYTVNMKNRPIQDRIAINIHRFVVPSSSFIHFLYISIQRRKRLTMNTHIEKEIKYTIYKKTSYI